MPDEVPKNRQRDTTSRLPVGGGAIRLSQLLGRLEHLEVGCARCSRAGRLSVRRLVAEHGPGASLLGLRPIVAAGCPLIGSAHVYQQCGVLYPNLLDLGL